MFNLFARISENQRELDRLKRGAERLGKRLERLEPPHENATVQRLSEAYRSTTSDLFVPDPIATTFDAPAAKVITYVRIVDGHEFTVALGSVVQLIMSRSTDFKEIASHD